MNVRVSIFLLVATALVLSSQASTYAPLWPMTFFKPFVGTWDEVVDGEGDQEWKLMSVGSYFDDFRAYRISQVLVSGGMSFSSYVHLTRQNSGLCHAMYYHNGRSQYFKGTPVKGSKVLVMERLAAELEQDEFLVIDFTGCPEKRPTVRSTNDKPTR